MPPTFELEVCVESCQAALVAQAAGATRIEINRELRQDGLTPDTATCLWLKQHCQLPVIAMLRPHARSFHYTPAEKRAMLSDCEQLLAAGVDGIACGGVDHTNQLDVAFIHSIVRLCGPREVVVHRVFDDLGDLPAGLKQLIDCGVRRVLTSGGAPTVPLGLERLRALVEWSAGQIEILPGGGVKPENSLAVLKATGCHQLHGTFRRSSALPLQTAEIEPDAVQIQAVRQLMADYFPG